MDAWCCRGLKEMLGWRWWANFGVEREDGAFVAHGTCGLGLGFGVDMG
jgi:hypothetical protein